MNIRKRTASLLNLLNQHLFERGEAIRLTLLSALAGESIFLLGPPGVAKSLIARRIKHIFHREAKSFEYLMNRFSTPDEIFGPISVQALKHDRYVRITDSYLPDATVVFLDEIWKAGPSIQNTLLTVINERVYRNGGVDQKVKLRALISASNELPAKGEGLGALWDRFLIRLEINNVTETDSFYGIILEKSNVEDFDIEDDLRFSENDLDQIAQKVSEIDIPDEVLRVIDGVRARINLYNHDVEEREKSIELYEYEDLDESEEFKRIYVSDRRWKKIVWLMRTSAYLNGRNAVDITDCCLIQYCIWSEKEQIEYTKNLVFEAVAAVEYDRLFDLDSYEKQWQSLKDHFPEIPTVSYQAPAKYGEYYLLEVDHDKDYLTYNDEYCFRRLPIAEFERLQEGFIKIGLWADNTDEVAHVDAALGTTPNVVLLRNRDKAMLSPFPSTGFTLSTTSDARSITTSIDRGHPEFGEYVRRVDDFRKEVVEQKKRVDEYHEQCETNFKRNLFAPEAEYGFLINIDKLRATSERFYSVVSEIDRFKREKNLKR